MYPPGTLDRIRFIKQAQIHGLTLGEIGDLLGFQDRKGRERCRQVQKLLTRKLADIDGRLQQLQEFRRTCEVIWDSASVRWAGPPKRSVRSCASSRRTRHEPIRSNLAPRRPSTRVSF